MSSLEAVLLKKIARACPLILLLFSGHHEMVARFIHVLLSIMIGSKHQDQVTKDQNLWHDTRNCYSFYFVCIWAKGRRPCEFRLAESRGRWSSGTRTKRNLHREGFLDNIQEWVLEVNKCLVTKKVCQSLEKTMSKSSSSLLVQWGSALSSWASGKCVEEWAPHKLWEMFYCWNSNGS